MRKYVVTLTAEEREQLKALMRAGKASALKLARARVLLKADAAPGGPGWPARGRAMAAGNATPRGHATAARVRHGRRRRASPWLATTPTR